MIGYVTLSGNMQVLRQDTSFCTFLSLQTAVIFSCVWHTQAGENALYAYVLRLSYCHLHSHVLPEETHVVLRVGVYASNLSSEMNHMRGLNAVKQLFRTFL